MWNSFHFNENTEILDAYVTCIREVPTLLGYGEPQVLDIFKNTLPMRLFWALFPIEDLRLTVETAQRTLTKEKIDKQLAGQSSLMPFMNIRDGYNIKKVVTFNTHDRLDDKIDTLTSMMSKLTSQGTIRINSLNPRYIKAKGEDKQEIIIFRVIIRIDIDQIVEIGELHSEVEVSMDRIIEEGHNMLTPIEMILGETDLEECKIKEVRTLEMEIEVIIEMTTLEEVEVSLGKDNIQVILCYIMPCHFKDQIQQ